jgi:hypothetical protein
LRKIIRPIRIGIDLDNTIISYDRAFRLGAILNGLVPKDCKLNKKALRDQIRKQSNGESKWQKLQGYIYSEGIINATLFPGVYRFLWRCYERNIEVEVVSHKTEYGHFDIKKTSLRESATNFLINQGLLDKKNPLIKKITYKSSQKEKIDYIKNNNYEWFIDDLEQIIFSPELKYQKSILLSNEFQLSKNSNKKITQSWEEISQLLLGDWSLEEVKNMTNLLNIKNKTESIEKLQGRGNSAIYKLFLNNGDKSALKIYPEISYHDRLKSEFESTRIFKELKINNVQKPISFNKSFGIATYEWIEGERVSSYGKKELNAALSFLSVLHQNSKAEQFNFFPMAADACPRVSDIEKQINRRLVQFNEASLKYIELENFINNDFQPVMKEIISWSKASFTHSSNYKNPIKNSELILSPSDFGFHNALCSQNNRLIFHDFEYFGWDDPVKLISDFSHHAAMNLSDEMEQLWFVGVSKIYGNHLLARLRSAWPLYGLNWCLIILNEFKDDVWNRRCAADDTKAYMRDELLAAQLDKSKSKLEYLALNYKDKYYW